MSSIDWGDCLSKAITIFREAFYKEFNYSDQENIKKKAFDKLPFEPCQFEVLGFEQKKRTALIMVHDKNLPDMSLNVRKDIKSLDESEFVKKYKMDDDMVDIVKSILSDVGPKFGIIIILSRAITVLKEPLSPTDLAESFLLDARSELRSEQVNAIQRSAEGLKKSIAKVPEKEVREELLTTTKKIDEALKEIKRVDEEIDKVRRLVGLTKEVQDWKLLISDVDRLKGEHVPREVFDTEIKRIDEKINKGLEALNTRIEDLKAIKFWSKRTVLEIALAVWGAIVSLYAAGIIKF